MRDIARLMGAGLFLIYGAIMLALATSSPEIAASLTIGPSDAVAIDLIIPVLTNPLGEAIRLSVSAPFPATLLASSPNLTPEPIFWMMLFPFLAVSSHFFWQRWELL